jgi:hypothetical protein
MSTSRKYYVGAAVLLLAGWATVVLFAPEASLWDTLATPLMLAGGFVLIPVLFGPLDDSLKKWHRG